MTYDQNCFFLEEFIHSLLSVLKSCYNIVPSIPVTATVPNQLF